MDFTYEVHLHMCITGTHFLHATFSSVLYKLLCRSLKKNQSALKKNETFTFSPPTNLEESKHYVPAFFKHAKGNHPRAQGHLFPMVGSLKILLYL